MSKRDVVIFALPWLFAKPVSLENCYPRDASITAPGDILHSKRTQASKQLENIV